MVPLELAAWHAGIGEMVIDGEARSNPNLFTVGIELANHGYLTVGKTLEEAAYLGVLFENAARLHLLAKAAGAITPIKPELAQEAHDFLLRDSVVEGTFKAWADEILRGQLDVADLSRSEALNP